MPGRRPRSIAVAGSPAGDVAQRLVVEDHVGRQLLRPRDLETVRLECREQALVGDAERLAGIARSRILRASVRFAVGGEPAEHAPCLALAARRVLARQQLERSLALEHGTTLLRHQPSLAVLDVLRDQPGGLDLPEHRAPAGGVVLGADAEGRQVVVAVARDRLGDLADEQVGEVAGKEAAGGAQDRRHRLLRLDHAVDHRVGTVADVAETASRPFLAEGGEQRLAAAARALAQRQQRGETPAFHRLARRRGVRQHDLALAQADVALAPQHQRVGPCAVAAGAADLLVVALDRARQVGVADEAHVRLVDTHAEGDGCHDHHAGLLEEGVLVGMAQVAVHSGVVGQGVRAVCREDVGELLHALARRSIDDAGLALARAHHGFDLLGDIGLLGHGEVEVGPVERAHEAPRLAPEQLGDDLLARGGIGRGGDRDHLRVAERVRGGAQLHVFRPEVVAPLRDAMGLVDGEAVAASAA